MGSVFIVEMFLLLKRSNEEIYCTQYTHSMCSTNSLIYLCTDTKPKDLIKKAAKCKLKKDK